jgi:hypothetical protein
VVECGPLCQTQCTVLPAGIVVVFDPLVWSTNTKPPFGPTLTVAVAGTGVGVTVGPPGVGVIVAGAGVRVGVPGPVVGVAVTKDGPVTVLLSLLQ